MMNKLILLFSFSIVFLTSCSQFDNEYDFRNFLRDRHPYSKIKKLENLDTYDTFFQVNDTINNEIWIYKFDNQSENYSSQCITRNLDFYTELKPVIQTLKSTTDEVDHQAK